MNALTETSLVEFIRYNNWANRQVLQVCQKLSEDQLATRIPGAYGTIHDTLAHILRSEAYYVKLLTDTRPQPAFKWEDRPGLPELIDYHDQVAAALEAAANSINRLLKWMVGATWRPIPIDLVMNE